MVIRSKSMDEIGNYMIEKIKEMPDNQQFIILQVDLHYNYDEIETKFKGKFLNYKNCNYSKYIKNIQVDTIKN